MSGFIADSLKDAIREPKYKKYQQKITCSKYPMQGIRMVHLRACAKQLAQKIQLSDLIGYKPSFLEELTTLGLIIAYYPADDIREKFEAIDYFISINDNWSTSDTIISTIKDRSDYYFEYLMEMMKESGWRGRFAITSLLWLFLDKEHIHTIFDGLYSVSYGDYYVDMAVSWLLSKAYEEFKDEVEEVFENAPLNKFVLKTTFVKIRDIVGISQQEKDRMEEILKDVLCKKGMF